jgi:hypothetical protein
MRRVFCLVILGSLLGTLSGAINPNEFECEQAVAHVEACCGSEVNVQCGGTCDDVDLKLANAVCLSRASCESLIESGACEDPTRVACK